MSHMYQVYVQSICYSSQILVEVEFSRQIFKNLQISMFTEICPVRAKFLSADGQRDWHDEACSRYS
jgi:3-methyladenine DNA glycosylase Tag